MNRSKAYTGAIPQSTYKMESHTSRPVVVPLFSGQGSTATTLALTRQQALRDIRSPHGHLLLTSCHEAFYAEVSKLSEHELSESYISLIDFQEASSLLSFSSFYEHNPIISGISLFLVQALRYLAYLSTTEASGLSSTEILRNTNHHFGVVGFSSGIITACVVGASGSVLTFISNAVEAFRLAFWIGMRSMQERTQELRSALMFPDTQLPWSIVCVGLTKPDVLCFISDFEIENNCGSSLHLTAVLDDRCLTVSGRPDILHRFSSSISRSCTTHPTTMDTLYHAHTLRRVHTQVLADVAKYSIRFPDFSDLRYPVLSTISGKCLLPDAGYPSLVDAVLDMIIVSPADWMSVVQGLASAVPVDASIQILNFGPGPGLLRTLEKSLSTATCVCTDVSVCGPSSTTEHNFKQEPIAIVGMALRMPGAKNANELWEILERGISTISEIPADRFQVAQYTSSDTKRGRTMKVHTGNFLECPYDFDYKYFKVSPREARSMDPQQRILLHTAHDALENAGYVPDATPSFQRDTFGCFIGSATQDHADNLREDIDVHYSTGTLKAFLSGRISYAMQFGGPSVVVDTACSSSIVAIHQACRALMNRDCSAAIAGGVNVMSSPNMFIGLERGHFLSPSGQCKSFDASADGYSRAEGCSLFILKRLSDAVAENDNILGVIRGVEVNQSGLAHSITHPHAPTQVALLKRLLQKSSVDASRVSVVEAHGTGTQAGDSSELESIRTVLCRARDSENPLHITSIKANIGHLEAASGAAGLAKLLLMFQHDTIPAQISLKTLNPRIASLEQDYTIIDTLPSPWMSGTTPRIAVLNNFGASGSNGALILEEYPKQAKASASATSYIFGISAKSREVLEDLRLRYIQWLRDARNRLIPLRDIAYTATARRQLYPFRISVNAGSKEQLVQALGNADIYHFERTFGQAVFVFSGQGSYYRGMGALLYSTSTVFQRCIDRCHRYLVSKGFVGILPIILGDSDSADGGLDEMEEFEASQTATLALEFSLATLWIHWGLTPSAVIGHSLGEYAALVVADVLSLEAALFLVASRARFTWRSCALGATGMLAIRLGEHEIKSILETTSYSEISIACVNSHRASVVSGPLSQLHALSRELATTGCKAVLLTVPYGYHSRAMDPVLDDLTQLARTVPLSSPKIPVGSTVLGRVVHAGDTSTFNATYFSSHCRLPVRFAPTVDALCKHPSLPQIEAWIEMGPQASCLSMIQDCSAAHSDAVLLPSSSKYNNAWSTLTASLSQLYRTSAPVTWRNVCSELSLVTCTDLPPYPLEGHKFWVQHREPSTQSLSPPQNRIQSHLIHDYTMLQMWVQYPSCENGNSASFDTPIDVLVPYIQGHKVAGHSLCPASVYIEQALSGAELSRRYLGFDFGNSMAVLRGVHFAKPLVYRHQVNRVVRTHITIHEDGTGFFTITSRLQSTLEESVHVRGEIRFRSIREMAASLGSEFLLIARDSASEVGLRDGCQAETFSARTAYDVVFPRVVEYSERYRTIQSLTTSADGMDGVARVKLPSDDMGLSFAAHPIFVDTLLHVAGFLANLQGDISDAYICSEIESFKMLSELIDQEQSYTVHCHGSWLSFDNIIITDAYAVRDQEPRRFIAQLKGIQFKRVRLSSLARGLSSAADPSPAKTRQRTDSNAIISPVSPESIIFGRSRSSTQSTDQFCGVQISDSGSSSRCSRPSSPDTLVSDDDTGTRIRYIIAQVLGLPTLDIHNHSDFKSLGLDSLSSLEALQALKTEFNVDLPHNTFAYCSTIASLNSFLDSPPSPVLERNRTSTETLRLTSFDTRLARLQVKQDKTAVPLLLIHDGSGLTSHYESLLPLHREVFALANPRLITGGKWETLEQMAESYTDVVLGAIPDQIIIGGWSFGGILAFEIARRLVRHGRHVLGIILIDSPCPGKHGSLPTSVIEHITKSHSRGCDSETMRLVEKQFRESSRLLSAYNPFLEDDFRVPIVLLRSSEGFTPSGLNDVPDWLQHREKEDVVIAEWEAFTHSTVKTWSIPGNHFEPFDAENVDRTSQQLIDACHHVESIY
ncbi:putative polyketide synthase [Rhizopogon vinicolor AM-OR11-026]|uniref:Putative polyketide synthase n=1 Tax=Rhizopogon vinicolor AM-OR11-026 TaxID=1314800 RepID=A0A1B7MV63_9AGAM|nr:putative polyketide synthase [Rhizopogon vinicolor AM-OR11-026]